MGFLKFLFGASLIFVGFIVMGMGTILGLITGSPVAVAGGSLLSLFAGGTIMLFGVYLMLVSVIKGARKK
jgi:hypothetical protein